MKTAIKLIVVLCVTLGIVSEVHDVKVSERFAAHIESLEGFKAKAYKDIDGDWTIGFGHLIKANEPALKATVLTREQAIALLVTDMAEAEEAVNRLVKVNLRQEQYDALVSFVFNIGQGAFAKSTLLKKLNAQHCCAVPEQMRRWVKTETGAKSPGLMTRREAEIALYVGDS